MSKNKNERPVPAPAPAQPRADGDRLLVRDQLLVQRLQFERKTALNNVSLYAERLRQEATSEERVGDGAGTPGNLARIASQLECARQRAQTARLSLDLLGAPPEAR